jgi:hypothetical protein
MTANSSRSVSAFHSNVAALNYLRRLAVQPVPTSLMASKSTSALGHLDQLSG